MTTTPHLQPRLVVRDAPRAIQFYVAALGAEEVDRYTEPSGTVVHCELRIGESSFSLTEEDVDHSPSPLAIGGSGLLLRLTVLDADAVGQAMVAGGAEVIVPIEARYYGPREGRVRDPFGHLWILSQEGEDLSKEQVQARIDQGA
jgi:PhnB protein